VVTSGLIVKLTLGRLLVAANALSVIAAFVFLAVALTEHLYVAVIVGVGSAAPAALSKAITVDRHVIGSASGLYGVMQMAVGDTLTALVGLGHNPALAAASVLAMAGIVAQISFYTALRDEYGRPTGV
jgi:DHA1 family bicyclomycin/chloramphenicol resistance-like MFS transporter